jgi:hypothetical protein
MGATASKLGFFLSLATCLFPIAPTLPAKTSAFVGTWQPPDWNDLNSMGMEFRIVQRDIGLSGSVHFRLARGEHQANMLNPKVKGVTLLFEVDDDYFGQKLAFSMTIQKGGNTALVQSWGRDMFSDFLLVKQP